MFSRHLRRGAFDLGEHVSAVEIDVRVQMPAAQVVGRTNKALRDVTRTQANGVAPLAYFEHLYEHLPLATTAAELEALLPWNVKAPLKERKRRFPCSEHQ
jgi:hypothetical protein